MASYPYNKKGYTVFRTLSLNVSEVRHFTAYLLPTVCTECADFVYEYCSIHGPLLVIPDDKVPAAHPVPPAVPRAALTVPHVFLHLARSTIPGAGIGVFTSLTLPRGVRFGPYRGRRADGITTSYCWQIYGDNNRASHVVDAGDASRSNWMRYVNCSRHWCEQNLIAYQYRGQIYYRTIRIVPKFTELMVFYGSEFANLLGVDLKRYNSPPSFEEKLGSTKSNKFTPRHGNSIGNPSVKDKENPKPSEKIHESNILQKPLILDETNKIPKKLHEEKNIDLPKKQRTKKTLATKIQSNRTRRVKKRNSANTTKKFVHINETNNIKLPDTDSALGTTFETTKCVEDDKLNNNSCTVQSRVDFSIESKYNNTKYTDSAGDATSNSFPINTFLFCDKCPFKTTSEKHLNSHLNAHVSDRSFNCDKCHYKTSRLNSYKLHNNKHSGVKPYSCTVCSKAFTQHSHLQSHVRIHSGVKPYSCTVCSKAFSHHSTLQRHVRIHSGIKPYSCTVCNKAFTRHSTLQTHVRIHSGVKPYSCTVCNKAFTRHSTLQTHVRIHSGVKPYSCTVCNKAFTQHSHLQRHVRIHSGVKPYSCTVCSKAFTRHSTLQSHMRIHSGVKPYSCTVCNKAFTQHSTLQTHVRIHSGVKPYSCTVCNKAFNDRSNLQTHVRIHSGVKPYSCTVCSKAFNHRNNLQRHVKIHS